MQPGSGVDFRLNYAVGREPGIKETIGYPAAMLDADGDGRLDLLLAGPDRVRLFRNLGDWRFQSVADAGFRQQGYWQGVAVGDVDRDGRPVPPDFFVNVAAQMETKTAMLAEHASQREWLLAHHGIDDYLETMKAWTRENGARAGVPYGEGFRRYKGHPYPQSPLLEKLLGSAVVAAS